MQRVVFFLGLLLGGLGLLVSFQRTVSSFDQYSRLGYEQYALIVVGLVGPTALLLMARDVVDRADRAVAGTSSTAVPDEETVAWPVAWKWLARGTATLLIFAAGLLLILVWGALNTLGPWVRGR
jgi:hypothetical protein